MRDTEKRREWFRAYKRDPEKMRAYQAAYKEKNRAELKTKAALRHAKNKEQINALRRLERLENPEKFKAEARRNYLRNKSKNNARSAKWREDHKDELRVYFQEHYAVNRDKKRAIVREYCRLHPEAIATLKRNRRALKRGAEGSHTNAELQALLKRQKHRCANTACGVSIKDGFHADHIIPLALGGSNWISNIQLLCPTCNMRKSAKHPIDWAQENGLLL